MIRRLLPPRRWNVGAGVSVISLLAVAYVLAPHWSTQYGAALIIFSIWMVWFVVAAVHWLANES